MNSIWCRHLIETPSPYKNPLSTLFFRLGTLLLAILPQHRPILPVGWATHSFTYLIFLRHPVVFGFFASNMSLARIPLPSIALVLSSDHTALPSRPSVIKFEFDPLQTIHPTSSDPSRALVRRHSFLIGSSV